MAESKRRGRPKGSGEGLDVVVTTRLHANVVAVVDDAAAEQDSDRAGVVREIVTRWAERRKAKGSKR